jgi:hypothetical protein
LEFWENVFSGPIMKDVRKRMDVFHAFESGELNLESL